MEKRKSSVRYAPEVRERAVRMVLEHAGDHASQWEAIGSIAAKIGCTAETLRKWVRQAERERGMRAGSTSAERPRKRGWKGKEGGRPKPNKPPPPPSFFFARATLARRSKP